MNTCDYVVMALRSITLALELHYKQLLRNFGLSGPQIILLKALEAHGPRSISDVARAVHLSQATVTPMLERLEQKRLITRHPDEHDRRQVLISLTDRGRDMLQHAPSLLHERFIDEFTALAPWEQSQILSSLQRVASMVGAPDVTEYPVLSIAPFTASKANHSPHG